MGCYDTVLVPCPECGEIEYFQSKGGDCLMRDFTLDECPTDVLTDINRHAPYECQRCGTKFEVSYTLSKVLKTVEVEIPSTKVIKTKYDNG
jgi:predicted RNA-binding Zn-ribbon protein involved in translation (DUF1610 family)